MLKQHILPSFVEYLCICELKPELSIDITRVSDDVLQEFREMGNVISETYSKLIVQLEELPVITRELFGRKDESGRKFVRKTDKYHNISSARNEFMHLYDSLYGRAMHCRNQSSFDRMWTMKYEILEAMEDPLCEVEEKELQRMKDIKREILDLFERKIHDFCQPTTEELGYLVISDLIVLCNTAVSLNLQEYHVDPRDGMNYALRNNEKGKEVIQRVIGRSGQNWIDYTRKRYPDLFDKENKNTKNFHLLTLDEKIMEKLVAQEIFEEPKRPNEVEAEMIRKDYGVLAGDEFDKIWGNICLCMSRSEKKVKRLMNRLMNKKMRSVHQTKRFEELVKRYDTFKKKGNQGTVTGLFRFLRNILKYSKREIMEYEAEVGHKSVPWEFKVHQTKKILSLYPGLLQVMVGMYEEYQLISRRLDNVRETPLRNWKEVFSQIQPGIRFSADVNKNNKSIKCSNTFIVDYYESKRGTEVDDDDYEEEEYEFENWNSREIPYEKVRYKKGKKKFEWRNTQY